MGVGGPTMSLPTAWDHFAAGIRTLLNVPHPEVFIKTFNTLDERYTSSVIVINDLKTRIEDLEIESELARSVSRPDLVTVLGSDDVDDRIANKAYIQLRVTVGEPDDR
jgi:hypothetical protein